MVFPIPHKYLALSGTLRNLERWSFGFRMTMGTFNGSPTQEQETAEGIAAALAPWWAAQGAIGSAAVLDTVKLNAIGVDGKYLNDWTAAAYLEPGQAAGGGTNPYPNQITLAVTLETGSTRGLAHRGRFYLPNPTLPLDPDGRITAAAALSFTTKAVELLDLLEGASNGSQIVVMSNVREGNFRPVTGVSVGRVLDTMRSRRTSLDEDRQVADRPS